MRIIRPKKMEHHKVLYTNFRKYCPRCSLLVLRDVIMYAKQTVFIVPYSVPVFGCFVKKRLNNAKLIELN